MTPARPDTPQDQPRDEELSRLYRDAARGEPPATLDRLILEAARAKVARAGKPARRAWWRGWLAPVTAFATVVLTFTLTLLVHQEREREETKALSGEPAPVVPPAAPAAPAAEPAAPALKKDQEAPRRAVEPESALRRLERSERTPRPASPSPGPARSEESLGDAPSPATPMDKAMREAFPGAAREDAAKPAPSRSLESAAPAAAPATDTAPMAPPAAAPEPPRSAAPTEPAPAEARPRSGPPAGNAAGAASEVSRMRSERAQPQVADKALRSAEDWLEEIRALRKQGRDREAQEVLAQFRRAYPDYALPADLR